MFGCFLVGVIVFCCYVIVYFGSKNRSDKIFSGSFFASIFKRFARNLSKNSFYMEKDNCFDIIYFFRALFFSNSF